MSYDTLSQNEIGYIENLALDVLEDTFGHVMNITPPISLDPILKYHGIDLYTAKFNDNSTKGFLDSENMRIYISQDESYINQRYTVAHELGHFFLHKSQDDKKIFYNRDRIEYQDEKNLKMEREATVFAASLLMPKQLVAFYGAVYKTSNMLAHAFGVPNTVAYMRLKNLALASK